MQNSPGLIVSETRPRFTAIARAVDETERLHVGDAKAMSKDLVQVRIGRPSIAVPHFEHLATPGRHPLSHQTAANLVEIHRSPLSSPAGLGIPPRRRRDQPKDRV